MLQTIKVDVNELATGMFISGLDRPWLGTPFLTQGFLLQTQEDIVRVRDYCEFVFIDTHKSVYLTPKLVRQTGGERPRVPVEKIFEGHTITPYQDEVEWGEEHPRAKAALDTLLHDITDIYDQAAKDGKVDAIRVKKSADPVISSISRNPDACLWLGRLKRHDKYSYQHSISVAIWAVALGVGHGERLIVINGAHLAVLCFQQQVVPLAVKVKRQTVAGWRIEPQPANAGPRVSICS